MRQALTRVVGEDCVQAVLITGPAGIGKSRIRHELDHLIDALDMEFMILSGRAEPLRKETAFALLANVLWARARHGEISEGWPSLHPKSDANERRQAVLSLAGEVFDDAQTAAQVALFLGELVGVDFGDAPELIAAREDPQLMFDRLHLALLDYFAAAAEKCPVAIALEDLQWADRASLELLDELFDRSQDYPLLLVTTGRPEFLESMPEFLSGRDVTKIQLQGLASAEISRMANHVAGRRLPKNLLARLAQHTGGNPLFVEQIVSAMREEEAPLEEPVEDATDWPLPLTVEGAVQSRLDQLPDEERELCKRSSVFSRPFDPGAIEMLGVARTQQLLASLCRRELMVSRIRSKTRREREYWFATALIGEVAYRSLAEGLRTELHRRVGAYLATQQDADPEEVARHYELGGEFGQAAIRYVAATLAASRRADGRTVLRCSERALELGPPPKSLFSLHMARAEALRFLGRRGDQISEIRAALHCAQTDVQRARALIEQAVWVSRTGKAEDALEAADAAVNAAQASGNGEVIALAHGRRANALAYAGHAQEARASLERVWTQADEVKPHTQALIAEVRGQLAATVGDLGERREAFMEAADLYISTGDQRRAAACETNLADTYNRVGAYQEAEAALRDGLERCRRVGNRPGEGYALVNLGYSLTMLGRAKEALEVLNEASRLADAVQDMRLAVAARVYAARAHVQMADESSDDVAVEAQHAAEEAQQVGVPALQVAALTVAAAARLRAGNTEAALALSTTALRLRDELGSIEEDEAEVFLVHARALRAAGDEAGARRVIDRGRARLEQLSLQIADPIWRERFLNDVAAHRDVVELSTA
jgi:tetratricopeptide (TPR) repeat protein